MGDVMLYIILICLVIIGFLGFKLFQKQKIDREELEYYKAKLDGIREETQNADQRLHEVTQRVLQIQSDYNEYKQKREYEQSRLEECKKDLQAALDVYNDLVDNKMKAIDESIESQRKQREHDLEIECNTRRNWIDSTLEQYKKDADNTAALLQKSLDDAKEFTEQQLALYQSEADDAAARFQGIERVLATYEKERQAKLFYTIQLPEEYQDDIEFLLTTVAAKVQHPDIISKLVWAEYVKPNLDNTFKRIEIKPEAGIYKLTSLETGMSYIGKSTNVKNRIADHFKSSIGIKSIADQAVHHAILKEGFWNWAIEIITYTDKDKLNELEKYYIEFFKTQEFGYNKNSGGGG